MINITNILLSLIVIFLGYSSFQKVFTYFKTYKNKYFNQGVKMASEKAVTAIMEQAKKGKKFKVGITPNDSVELIMVTKKNAKSISKRNKRSSG